MNTKRTNEGVTSAYSVISANEKKYSSYDNKVSDVERKLYTTDDSSPNPVRDTINRRGAKRRNKIKDIPIFFYFEGLGNLVSLWQNQYEGDEHHYRFGFLGKHFFFLRSC